jgi:hypothetical protein
MFPVVFDAHGASESELRARVQTIVDGVEWA